VSDHPQLSGPEIDREVLQRLLVKKLMEYAGAQAIRRLKEVESSGLITEENVRRHLQLHALKHDMAHILMAVQYRERLICVAVLSVTGELGHKDCNHLVDRDSVAELAAKVANELIEAERDGLVDRAQ